MSDRYNLIVETADFSMNLIWALLFCLLYRHFFRLKRSDSRWAYFLPGVFWFGCKKLIDSLIIITFMEPAYTVKGLLKLFLTYGSLLFISFLAYQGNRKQLILITMMFAAVSEISRFLSFSLSIFWNRIYDLYTDWFERNYLQIDIEKYLSLMEKLSILQQISYTALFIVVMYGAFRYLRKSFKSRELPLHRTEFLFLMFPCTSSFLLCILLRIIMFTTEDAMLKSFYESFPLLIAIVPLLLVLCLFSMLYSVKLYQEMLTLNEERNRRAVLEKQIVSMEEHARELERIYSGVRSMKHDMKNQLAVLANLIEQQSGNRDLPDYLEQLNRTLGKLDIPFQTGSTVVDSLLSMKYHEICEKLPHINFEAENLIFPKSCNIQPTDLCIILGNALDNAIEACEKLAADSRRSECFIRLSSLCRKETLLLTVENSFNGELKIGQGSVFPSTTKPDSNAHGIGMHNIRAAAQRYQGGVSWEAKERQFTLTVMLANGDFDINASPAGHPSD